MRHTILTLAVALLLGACGDRSGVDDAPPAAGPAEESVDIAQEAQRIQAGMTEARVVEILGKPRIRVSEATGERLTFWTFDAQQKVTSRVYVSLDKEGKVISVETVPL